MMLQFNYMSNAGSHSELKDDATASSAVMDYGASEQVIALSLEDVMVLVAETDAAVLL